MIVVGSGASGGWAAKRLSEAGVKVAILEAGQAAARHRTSPSTSRLRTEIPQQGRRADAQDAATPARLLRLPRMELQVVRQRSRRAVHHARRQAIQLAGPHARGRRTHQRLGPAELSPERAGSQGQVVRRLRRRLAAQLQGPRTRTTTSSRTTSGSRDSPKASRSCPTASSCRRWRCRAPRRSCARGSSRSSVTPSRSAAPRT